ncbi:MAG: hypothetical protein GJ677_11325 [Rhodobacteraceae bacterium]|nr:hypothetical protein [Paracoccaceae bacterium]
MKLFYSQNSPFARIARLALRESGLKSKVSELLAANREPDNPVLEYSPVGRVPTLVDGDFVVTEAKNVFAYLVAKSNLDAFCQEPSNGWEELCQEGQILGFLDGIASWVRENRRSEGGRSDFLIQVEMDRSVRCLEFLDGEADGGRIPEFPVFRSLALAAALGLMDFHRYHPEWRKEYASLSNWFARQEQRDSMRETKLF